MSFQLLKKEKKHSGKIIDLTLHHVRYPSGNESVREVVEHPGGAVILAVFENDDILLVNQYRHPVETNVVELPAGKLDSGEDPLVCAQRELREETGYLASQWRKITTVLTTPGFCNEQLHVFLAERLSPDPEGTAREEGEQSMVVLRLSLHEAIARITRGEINDAKTIVGIMLGKAMIQRHGKESE